MKNKSFVRRIKGCWIVWAPEEELEKNALSKQSEIVFLAFLLLRLLFFLTFKHHTQNKYRLQHVLGLDSDFCSGNLSRVQKGNNRGEYFLWVSHDSAPYIEDGYKTWFYFSVNGVPQGEQLTFTFKNLNCQSKLYG